MSKNCQRSSSLIFKLQGSKLKRSRHCVERRVQALWVSLEQAIRPESKGQSHWWSIVGSVNEGTRVQYYIPIPLVHWFYFQVSRPWINGFFHVSSQEVRNGKTVYAIGTYSDLFTGDVLTVKFRIGFCRWTSIWTFERLNLNGLNHIPLRHLFKRGRREHTNIFEPQLSLQYTAFTDQVNFKV